MTLASITQILSDPHPKPVVVELDLTSKFTEADQKAIRSAVLRFNLTHPESNLVSSYELIEVQSSIIRDLKNGHKRTWFRVARFVGCIALTIFLAIRLDRYAKGDYIKELAEATIKVASGTLSIVTRNQLGWVISSRRAEISDFVTPIWQQYLSLIFIAGMALFLCEESLRSCKRHESDHSRFFDRLRLKIKSFDRVLPYKTSQNTDKTTGNFIDLITQKTIPENHLKSARFIYLRNGVVDARHFLKSQLETHGLIYKLNRKENKDNLKDLAFLEVADQVKAIFDISTYDLYPGLCHSELNRIFPYQTIKTTTVYLTKEKQVEAFLSRFDSETQAWLKDFSENL